MVAAMAPYQTFLQAAEELLVFSSEAESNAEIRVPVSMRNLNFYLLAPAAARRDTPEVRVFQTGGPLAVEAPDVKASAEAMDTKAGLFRITVQFPEGTKETSYRVLIGFVSETGVAIPRDVTLHRHFPDPGNPPPGESSSIKSEPIR